jgi:hypothetical protein
LIFKRNSLFRTKQFVSNKMICFKRNSLFRTKQSVSNETVLSEVFGVQERAFEFELERKVTNWRIITASPATQRLMRIKTHQNTSMQDQPVDYPDVRLETKKFTTLNPANWQRTVYRNQGKTHSSQ